MLNQDIFVKPPSQQHLKNNGVAEVNEDNSESSLAVLRYELETFVCDGQYAQGLEVILRSFLAKLSDGAEQPGVWISGFYGSGKSHLAKMLRALWVDVSFADGRTARSLPKLPETVSDYLKELTTAGRRHGGLHAAAGKLGAGAGDNVRLALLGLVFKSAGLPEQVPQARFVMWLKHEGLLADFERELAASGKTLEQELPHLYVSPVIAKALIKILPGFAASEAEARSLLKTQFPQVQDVSNDEMTAAIKEALSVDGKFPLTLVVLDEVQQYIGDDAHKAYQVQEVTETCCKHFSGKLLFVATGQTALSGMPNLQRLMGRFPLSVMLSDADVEHVIREIILAKKPSARSQVENVLRENMGEISRHLRGTKLEHVTDDETVWVEDYPILPVRRRFWERVLRTIDATGTVSQLRNQLRIVHEAVVATASDPLGEVVSGDFLYDQNSANLLATAAIPREVYEHIQKLRNGDTNAQLKAKALKLIYLINKMPVETINETGLHATVEVLADLLVTDLRRGSSELRKVLPALLDELQVQDRMVMALDGPAGTEYRLLTRESSSWYEEYRSQEAQIKAAPQRLEVKRSDLFKQHLRTQLAKVKLSQGRANEFREIFPSFDDTLPKDHAKKIYVWTQDGWQTEEKSLLAEARNQAPDDPTLFLFVPAQHKSDLANALIAQEAAANTLQRKGTPSTEEGRDAMRSMETRLRNANQEVQRLLDTILSGARLFQAGGQEVVEGQDLAAKVFNAAQASVVRLYRDFDIADHPTWGKVVEEARKGGAEALKHIGHSAEPEKHPVCAKVLGYIGPGKKGQEIREMFKSPPYGWPQDAIDGALYTLLATGHLRATDASGSVVDAKSLERSKLTNASFRQESITITTVQKLKIRKLFQELGVAFTPDQELQAATRLISNLKDLAQAAGGLAPLPEVPDLKFVHDLEQHSGNALLWELHQNFDQIVALGKEWQKTAELIAKRKPSWNDLNALLQHAATLNLYPDLKVEIEALVNGRSLLVDPDPVRPLIEQVATGLRKALSEKVTSYRIEFNKQLELLNADSNWKAISEDQRNSLIKRSDLKAAADPDISTDRALIESLDAFDLARWDDHTQALPSRFENARLEAARLILPDITKVVLPARTLRTTDDVEKWLGEVKSLLIEKVSQGPVAL